MLVIIFVAGTPYAQSDFTLTNADGAHPSAPLVQGLEGNLYGITPEGGTNGAGTIFKITPAGSLSTLFSFPGNESSIVPTGGLIQADDGNLYGTSSVGGVDDSGTVFKITTSGVVSILHSFSKVDKDDKNADGARPSDGLTEGKDGDLYGRTRRGGMYGLGTVFKITTTGTLSSLYSFSNNDTAPGLPSGGLIQGNDGNLYGTIENGGINRSGAVFTITTTGVFKTLHSLSKIAPCPSSNPDAPCPFKNVDGAHPDSGLIQGKDGNLYGSAESGGVNGSGTVFKITTVGVFKKLYSFSASLDPEIWQNADGASPGRLIQGQDGNLYGSAAVGGMNSSGTVFKITTSGVFRRLYKFSAVDFNGLKNADGSRPLGGLIQVKAGNLYGTTTIGGANGTGTVFKITPSGKFTSLFSFSELYKELKRRAP